MIVSCDRYAYSAAVDEVDEYSADHVVLSSSSLLQGRSACVSDCLSFCRGSLHKVWLIATIVMSVCLSVDHKHELC